MSTRKFTIRAALRAHLLGMDDLPPIKWENQKLAPSGTFLRETLMPADEILSANNELTGIGIYQLDLIVPTGSSISTAENLADDIKEHFRPAQILGGVQIERAAVGQGREDAPWYTIPISVDYRAYQLNNEVTP